MSDDNDFDDDDFAGLRRQYKEQSKALKDLQAQLAGYQQKERAQSVSSLLEKKGLKPGLSKFYTDEDTSEDAVSKWVADNADLFGGSPVDDANDANAQAARQVANQSGGEDPPVATSSSGAILGDPEELQRALENAGSYDDLLKLFPNFPAQQGLAARG